MPDRGSDTTASSRPSRDRSRVACVGMGFVGYHSAVGFCTAGRRVVGVDKDEALVESIRRGTHPFETDTFREHVTDGHCTVTTDISDAADCDTYVVSVPTPLDEASDPDLSALRSACQSVGTVLERGDLVVIQSTIYPGCSRRELVPVLETSGLDAGTDVGVSHVPERYSPGDDRSKSAPRVVGSIDDWWRGETLALYEDVTDSVVPVSSLEVAEAIKLVENVQRDVNIAIVNEIARALDTLGIDTWEVIDGADTKWNFHRYEPRLGVGGHCLPIDPHYFEAALEGYEADLDLVPTAREINRSMPTYYGDWIVRALESLGKSPSMAEVAVLGTAYKPNVEDTRNSPAVTLVRTLRENDVQVSTFDPNFEPNAEIESTGLYNESTLPPTIENADVAVFGAAHDEFQHLEPDAMATWMAEDPIVVDFARLLDPDAVEASDLTRLRALSLEPGRPATQPRSGPEATAEVGPQEGDHD
ncbi:nucleotide sugar dehydrogenase [Halopiger goleimassiliensis]|uniref:nucleotide sugar dehydrogenase n=1 Tax=Halopiger goleimassiliensis TaxID=1293048 RepID=UPI0009DC27E7|nr:nucleotide sugar dehydrogenase [Halopiger goleimassiliensis]